MKQLVILSGRTCTGKSKLAQFLVSEFGFRLVQTSEFLAGEAQRRSLPVSRSSLQELGDTLDLETDHSWVFGFVRDATDKLRSESRIVVDNIRNAKQLEYFRSSHDFDVFHVHLYASQAELARRFEKKKSNQATTVSSSYQDVDLIKREEDVIAFRDDADVRIFTDRTNSRDNLVRVAARLGLYPTPDQRCVDVIIGGQFGSEGKGHVAAYLAKEYDVLIRVGGPNAGHTVAGEIGTYTYHQLPSGCQDVGAIVLLGPGMTIDVEKLLREIKECGLTPDRLHIDPQAMIISEGDKNKEKVIVKSIASTGSGSGAAAARRILMRTPGAVRLAKDVPDLKPYVGQGPKYRGSTMDKLEEAYLSGKKVLLEGTQGSGLSLFHGPYPYVTSRDTNVAGCLAEAGISPTRVRRVVMVIRPTPIRVGDPDNTDGTSGPIANETDFDTVAVQAGIDPEEVKTFEKTSTTKRKRRVGWFDWDQFRKACALNAPTDIVLTFADYIHVDNRRARRFERLHPDTIKFIEEIERVAQTPVSLINTRFPRTDAERLDLRTIIDRRNWRSPRKG
jgi:adenylosuccinate synthase